MISDGLAIKVENLSKCYHIYDQPRDRLLQMLLRGRKKYYREFWALRNVSFEINKGETVGIIGRNGSGKSTLLQLICGTLNSSSGSVISNGRIAALLELGSGFNSDFTGRENIYTIGALFGLPRKEVNRRFDSIVAFADIGEFIEQPVKTYSTGMYVRLAFAVIVHVDAEILVIDEALAVGDAIFTQKCMRFLRDFKKSGTLVFVSHDMGSVLNLCERTIWLHEGKLLEYGNSKSVADHYMRFTMQELYGDDAKLQELEVERNTNQINTQREVSSILDKQIESSLIDYGSKAHVNNNLREANGWKTGAGEIVGVFLEPIHTQDDRVLQGGEMVRLTIKAKADIEFDKPILGFLVRDRLGQDLFGENTLPFTNHNPQRMSAGSIFEGEFIFRMPMLPNGEYVVMASLANGELFKNVQHHWLNNALIINVWSSKVRWGLVGVHFESVEMKKKNGIFD